MIGIASPEDVEFPAWVQTIVIGAGACGLTAALAARDVGGEVLVLERDESPFGSTSMSTGFIQAAATRSQLEQGIDDDPSLFLEDIQRKPHDRSDPTVAARFLQVLIVTRTLASVLKATLAAYGVPFVWLFVFAAVSFRKG